MLIRSAELETFSDAGTSSEEGGEEENIDDYNADTDSSPVAYSLNCGDDYDTSDQDQASLHTSDEEHGEDSDLDSADSQGSAVQESNRLSLSSSSASVPLSSSSLDLALTRESFVNDLRYGTYHGRKRD